MSVEARAAATAIEVVKNGPYRVSGACRVRNARREEVPVRGRFALCRCGSSASKPFCDGAHWAIRFDESRGRQAGMFAPPLGLRRLSFIFGGLLGAATVAAGLWLVLQMNGWLPRQLHLRGWKTLMRVTLAGYWTVAVLGLAIYYLWFMR